MIQMFSSPKSLTTMIRSFPSVSFFTLLDNFWGHTMATPPLPLGIRNPVIGSFWSEHLIKQSLPIAYLLRPKRPTPKIGRNGPGRNDPGPKRPGTAKTYSFRGRGKNTPGEWKIGYKVINKQNNHTNLVLNTAF